jgi:hypothetical protein
MVEREIDGSQKKDISISYVVLRTFRLFFFDNQTAEKKKDSDVLAALHTFLFHIAAPCLSAVRKLTSLPAFDLSASSEGRIGKGKGGEIRYL